MILLPWKFEALFRNIEILKDVLGQVYSLIPNTHAQILKKLQIKLAMPNS